MTRGGRNPQAPHTMTGGKQWPTGTADAIQDGNPHWGPVTGALAAPHCVRLTLLSTRGRQGQHSSNPESAWDPKARARRVARTRVHKGLLQTVGPDGPDKTRRRGMCVVSEGHPSPALT